MAAENEISTRKRPRHGDMKRVAEIVMVLSAMGEMRAGEEPTPAEISMAAEAREILAAICGDEMKPKDLFSPEAVRVAVDDLGLNRAKDPLTGFRPPKMSIKEKLLLTKKKMEEAKEITPHSSVISTQPSQSAFGTYSDSHGAMHGTPKFSSVSLSSGGFQAGSPVNHVPGHNSAVSSIKQSQLGETHHAAASMRTSTAPSLQQAETTNFRLDARYNQQPHMRQVVPAAGADYLPNSASSTLQSISTANNNPGQAYNLPDHALGTSDDIYAANAAEISVGNVQSMNSEIQAAANHGLTFIHGPSVYANHNDIAKNVQKILQPKVFNHPDWIPPSSDYTNRPINCQICKIAIMDVESLLVCDNCEKGTHMKCLQSYNNKGIPKAEWHCPRCLLSSNGKPLPPKYGRVTRSTAPSKPSSSTSVIQHSEKRSENVGSKVSQQKSVIDRNSGFLSHDHTSVTGSNHSESNTDSKAMGGGEIKVIVSTLDGNKREGEQKVAANHLDESRSEVAAPQVKLESTDIDVNNRGSTHDVQISSSEPLFHQDLKLEQSSEKQSNSVVGPTSSFQLSSDLKLDEEADDQAFTSQTHGISEPSTDEIIEPFQVEAPSQCKSVPDLKLDDTCGYQSAPEGEASTNKSNEPSKTEEIFEGKSSLDTTPDEMKNIQLTSNGESSNANELRECDNLPSGSSTVDWVGDILEEREQKIFYQSCRVSGILYKVHNQVLVSSNNGEHSPSEIQSLCEDKETGLKWASIRSYQFPKDLSSIASLPSTPEDNEVYASNNERIIPISSICGLCGILSADRFREETNQRARLEDGHIALHPIFICRWKYDEVNSTFQAFTD